MNKFTLLLLLILTQIGNAQEATKINHVLPEIISKFPNIRDFTISPDQDEVYFTVQGYSGELSTIVKVSKKNDKWSTPEIAPFSGKYEDLEAMFSPDGLKLYFVSARPLENTTKEAKDRDIWYIERSNTASEWSTPKNIGRPINTNGDEFYPSVSKNGNLYFTSTANASKGKDDIFVSRWEDNKYTAPISLSEAINSEGYEYNSYIAPDESFLIFGRYKRDDGLGSGDLYISYLKEGKWSKAKNLKKGVNSNKMDYCPFYDAKTNILYFTSKRSAVKAERQSQNLKELLQTMDSYENGLSRIYSTYIKF